jgi:GT2 family glycosyltransferase
MIGAIDGLPEFYAAVPKILFHDRPDQIWFAGGKISRLTGVVTHFGLNKKDSIQFDVSGPTYFMNGCCALIKAKAIEEIGVLDNQFFANSEDVDYSLRLLNAGHQIKYVPEAKIYHKVSHSFKANKGKWLAFYLAARGIVLLQRKHLDKRSLPLFYLAYGCRWVFYLTIKLTIMGDIKSIRAIVQGTWDGTTNNLRFVSK